MGTLCDWGGETAERGGPPGARDGRTGCPVEK